MTTRQVVGEVPVCPRRQEAPYQITEPPDRWEVRSDPENPGILGNGLSCCSYCGSLRPEDFMEMVRRGYYVTPTDKNYKVYIGRPYTDEETSAYKQSPHVKALLDAGADEKDIAIPVHHEDAKFYFQHLSPEQCVEFVDRYNAAVSKKPSYPDQGMKLAYPGYFYRLPFFMERKPREQS